MMTITEIAAKLGTNRAVAYGLVNFLQVKGLLKPVSKRSAGKGKPASLYQFNQEHGAALAALVNSLVDAPASAEAAPVEAPTQETPAAVVSF